MLTNLVLNAGESLRNSTGPVTVTTSTTMPPRATWPRVTWPRIYPRVDTSAERCTTTAAA